MWLKTTTMTSKPPPQTCLIRRFFKISKNIKIKAPITDYNRICRR